MAGSLEGFLITTHLQDYPWECDIGITICYGYLSSSLCYCSFFLLFFFLFTTAFNTHTKLFLQTYMNYLPHRAPVIRSYRRQRVHVSFAIYNPKSLHKNRSTHSNSARTLAAFYHQQRALNFPRQTIGHKCKYSTVL
jgi:hypothetical protein